MFIQTEETASPETVRFMPGRDVYAAGADFTAADAARSPLARRIFDLGSVSRVSLGADDIRVTKTADAEWHVLRPRVLAAIMDHFMSGADVIDESAAAAPVDAPADAPAEELTGPAKEIQEIVDTRIRPAAKDGGGDITFSASLHPPGWSPIGLEAGVRDLHARWAATGPAYVRRPRA